MRYFAKETEGRKEDETLVKCNEYGLCLTQYLLQTNDVRGCHSIDCLNRYGGDTKNNRKNEQTT